MCRPTTSSLKDIIACPFDLWYNLSVEKRYKRLFQFNKENLARLVELLKTEPSNLRVAEHFINPLTNKPVDHSTIFHWRKKFGIYPPRPDKVTHRKSLKISVKKKITIALGLANDRKYKPLEDNLMGERLNPGKLKYEDYVKESELRQIKSKFKLSPPPPK